MASTNNTGRNKFKETDLPFHLRGKNGKAGNQQIIQAFSSATSTSDVEIKRFTAGENGSKYDVIMVMDDGLAYKGLAESDYIHRVIGVATEDYLTSTPFNIQVHGSIVDNSASYDTTKPIFLRNTGLISQTQLIAITGSEDADIVIGLPLSATEFMLLTPFRYTIIL